MIEIFPAINAGSFEEVERRIKLAEGYAKTVHIDIADGTFTPRATWNNPAELEKISTSAKIELHIMVDRPEDSIAPWLSSKADRIIIHEESTRQVSDLIHRIRAMGKEVGLSIVPATSWERLVPYLTMVDMVQTLAVSPGPSGQAFDERTITKIEALRLRASDLPIEVDGGVNVGTASRCAHAGATRLVVGSALFDTSRPFAEVFEEISRDATA